MPIHVPVRWGELPRETWFSVPGRNSLRVRRFTSVWLHGGLFERHLPGSEESDEGKGYDVTRSHVCCLSLASCLAVTERCILGK